jgi:hypothetical protein
LQIAVCGWHHDAVGILLQSPALDLLLEGRIAFSVMTANDADDIVFVEVADLANLLFDKILILRKRRVASNSLLVLQRD